MEYSFGHVYMDNKVVEIKCWCLCFSVNNILFNALGVGNKNLIICLKKSRYTGLSFPENIKQNDMFLIVINYLKIVKLQKF